MGTVTQEVLEILYIEDDAQDARLLREALAECNDWCNLTFASDGAQALDMLFRRGKYKDYKLPNIILLDLNLPILSGHEVLLALKAHDKLTLIPVIVLSNSQHPDDINKAYDLGAACYIVKPRDFDHLTRICSALRDFWRDNATLPKVIAASAS